MHQKYYLHFYDSVEQMILFFIKTYIPNFLSKSDKEMKIFLFIAKADKFSRRVYAVHLLYRYSDENLDKFYKTWHQV